MRCEQTLLPEFSFTCFFSSSTFAPLLPKQINLLLYEILARSKAALFRLHNELQMQTRYEKSVKEKVRKIFFIFSLTMYVFFVPSESFFSLPPCLPCSFSALFSLSLTSCSRHSLCCWTNTCVQDKQVFLTRARVSE